MPMLHKDLTEKILQAFYVVYNSLGYGFLEKVYENALQLELQEMGLQAVTQQKVIVRYRGQPVGDYIADIIVNDTVVIELKAAVSLQEEHRAQLLNYLKATDKEIGLLLNFGKKPEFKRLIYTNDRKE
ncbi:MAG: GxxExxY protein [Anaerolineaceae bacterium]|nr:GxxExxY protein [Anaerolineaceae bacterium]MCB9102212.1 GxxExxY protein [Anaerolineales bacterium]